MDPHLSDRPLGVRSSVPSNLWETPQPKMGQRWGSKQPNLVPHWSTTGLPVSLSTPTAAPRSASLLAALVHIRQDDQGGRLCGERGAPLLFQGHKQVVE